MTLIGNYFLPARRIDQAMLQITENIILFAQQAEEESLLPTEISKKVKKAGYQRQFKTHDRTTRRSMTSVEAMEQDERRRKALTAQEKRQREIFTRFKS
jgi:hypothetical protein